MISAWWLFIIVPASAFVGLAYMAWAAAAGQGSAYKEAQAAWALRGELAKILAFLVMQYPDELEALGDDNSAADVAVALLADHAKVETDLHIALIRKDAQINNLCSRIKLLEEDEMRWATHPPIAGGSNG